MAGNESYKTILARQRGQNRGNNTTYSIITEIRNLRSSLKFNITATLTAYGPNYDAYPKWTTTNLTSWWTLGTEVVTGTGGVRDVHGTTSGTMAGDPTESTYDDLTVGTRRRFLNFDGTGDYIDFGDISTLDSQAAWSIAMRFRQTTHAVNGPLLSRYPSSNTNKQFLLEVLDDKKVQFTYATNASGGNASVKTTNETVDGWNTLVITHNTSSSPRTNIYLNGVDETLSVSGTVPTTLRNVSGNVYLARNESAGTTFTGDIHDVAYWSAELSSSEAIAYHTDARTDQIVAGFCRIPGSLSVETPNNRTLEPIRAKRKGRGITYQHQSTATI